MIPNMLRMPSSKIWRINGTSLSSLAERHKRVEGSGSVTIQTNGILRCQSSAVDARAYSFINFYLPSGSYAIVRLQGRQVGDINSQGRVSFDQHADNSTVGGDNMGYINPDSLNFKWYEYKMTGDNKNPFASITLGLWKAGIGTVEFKNISIEVYGAMNLAPEFRACMFKIRNGAIVHDYGYDFDGSLNPGATGADKCRFTNIGVNDIIWDGDTVQIQWDPFESWWRPVVFASVDYYDQFDGFTAHPGYSNRNSVNLVFNRMGKSNPQDALSKTELTSLTNNMSMFVHVMAICGGGM